MRPTICLRESAKESVIHDRIALFVLLEFVDLEVAAPSDESTPDKLNGMAITSVMDIHDEQKHSTNKNTKIPHSEVK